MSDSWDIDYHLRKLTDYSGHEWAPKARSLDDAVAMVQMQRRLKLVVTSTMRTLTTVIMSCTLSVLAGIAIGVLQLTSTTGPIQALILPAIPLGIGAGVSRFLIGIYTLPRYERGLADAEHAYRAALDKAVQQ